jgi:3'-phosphoadenosine 5'-phosphosulfate sulfotransferase (PAPS reductase)/FAD synthetase
MQHDREKARLWARHPTHLRRLARASSIIADALALGCRSYVAFSGGKDSAALLALVLEQDRSIEARMLTWPETELLGNHRATIEAWQARGANVVGVGMTRHSLDERSPDRWHRLHAGFDMVFVGLREDESRARAISLRSHGAVYAPKSGPVRVCPLAGFETIDVAAVIVSRDLPTLNIYDRDGFDARSSTRVPRAEHSIRENMLASLRERDPVAYARLRELYPEVA